MKCKYCGSSLTIDDERCPYCGADNPFAVKHRKEMKYFKKQFQKTKESVIEKNNYFHGWTARITVIAVLVALNVILLFMTVNAWEIRSFIENGRIERNLNKHIIAMKSLEEERDYIGLVQYYNNNRLRLNRHFKEYESLESVCHYYQQIYTNLPDVNDIEYGENYTKDNRAESLASYIYNVYHYSKQNKYSDEMCFSKEHVDTMNDLKQDLQLMLKTYCGFHDEELNQLPTLSKARIQLIIERGLEANGENEK